MSKINEDIFTAIDLIVGKRLEEISYDITKPYTIKEVKENGEYVVYDTSMVFTAYSTEDYKVDDRVYVTIPNGDFNSTKIIIGKEKEYGETGKPYDYVSPEEAIIPLEYITQDTSTHSLLATSRLKNYIFTNKDSGRLLRGFNIPTGTTQIEVCMDITNLAPENDQVYVELETIDTMTNTEWSYKLFNDKVIINEFSQTINFKFFTLLENDTNTYEIKIKELIAKIPLETEEGEEQQYESVDLLEEEIQNEIQIFNSETVNQSNYTRLLLKGNFKTLLPPLTYEGNYGLKLVLGYREMGAAPDETLKEVTLLLDNLESMIGNPYSFAEYFEQAQVYDISELGQIVSATLSFYQLDNFKYKAFETDVNGTPLPYVESAEFGGALLDNNLFVKDISIALGYDSSTIEGDYVELYTDNIIYDETTGNKNIKLRWAQKQEDGRYTLKTSVNLNETINWFVYKVGASSTLGENWEQIQVDAENNNATNRFSIKYAPNLEKTGDRLRAQVIVTNEDETKEIYTTPTLLLEHRIPVADQATLEATTRFVITSDDNLNGNYYIYGANGRLISTGEASKPRNIYIEDTIKNVKYKYKENIENGWQSWEQFPSTAGTNNPTISVEWDTVPSEKSMIVDFLNGQYKISSYFTTSKIENNLACTIKQDKRKFYSSTEFKFGIAGSNGSEYTLALSLSNNKNFITTENYEGAQEKVEINTVILNSENKEVQLSDIGKHLTYDLIYGSNIKLIEDENQINTNQIVCLKDATVETKSGAIVKVVLSKDAGLTNYDLEAYMPVGLATSNVGYVIGATEVIYDSYGKADYYKNPYQIFTKEHLEEEDNPTSDLDGGWYTKAWKVNNTTLNEITNDFFKPNIDEDNRLNPSSFYDSNNDLTNKKNYYIIYYEGEYLTTKGKKEIKWSSPIFITQNRYPSTTLNKWDGELEMNTKNNYILTRAFAAGSKNSENKFTGVVIGDWSHLDAEESLTSETGIYGLKDGAQTFGFKEDGTAFIGPSGGGRILFDGEHGTIGSDGSNLLIDFVGHTIESKALTIDAEMTPGDNSGATGAKFYLSNTNNNYFEISHLTRVNATKIQSSPLIKIGNGTYCLQSQDYSTTNQTGTKIDLANGDIKSFNFTLNAKRTKSPGIYLSNESTDYLQVFGSDGTTLMNIGSSGYYLQSKNYNTTSGSEAGTRINLTTGTITSYGFTLDARTSATSDTSIFLSNQSGSKMFSVGKGGTNLLYIGNTSYYLQSKNYNTTSGSEAGTKIDLNNGTITSYGFTLDARTSATSDTSIFLSNQSGSKMFSVGKGAKNLLYVGSTSYYLQSKDYDSTTTSDGYVTAGIHINLANGNIKSPNFMLTNATSADNPAVLKLKGSIEVTSGGKIGGWSVGATTLYYNSQNNNSLNNGSNLINADNNFIVTTKGALTCYGATLKGGTAANSSIVTFNPEGVAGENASVDNFALKNGSYITNKTFRAGMNPDNTISNTSFAGGFIFGRSGKKARFGLTSRLNPFIEKTETNEATGIFRYVFAANGNIEYQILQSATEGSDPVYTETQTMATQSWVTNKKYATQSWVEGKGYLVSSDLDDYAKTSTLSNYLLTSTYTAYVEVMNNVITRINKNFKQIQSKVEGLTLDTDVNT